ncbi:MAG: response regulator [Lachnospiraceae bacterium]|nr:response regulator [Lachnospiraceae bacterium]
MKKVLILEDNRIVVETLKEIVKDVDRRVEIIAVKSMAEARRLATEEEFNLFIVDIILNQENPNDASGLDFISFIREIKKYDFTPIIIATSIADSKLYAYDTLNCFRYIEKPFDVEQVRSTIERAFQVPQKTREDKYIHLRDDNTIQAQKVSEIVYIYYKERKLTIRSVDGTSFFYYKSIRGIKRQLVDNRFLQCNRNTLINCNFVLKIDIKNNKVILKQDYGEVALGSIYKKKIIEEFAYD